MRAGAKKPTNIAKTPEVLQKRDESLADFYERLCEAFRIYTPFDPEVPENHRMVLCGANIRQKLQKLEGFTGKNAGEFLEIANKVV